MGSPVPLSVETVGVITRLRNMKVGSRKFTLDFRYSLSLLKGRGRRLVAMARCRLQGKGPVTSEGYAPTKATSSKSTQTRWTSLDRCRSRGRDRDRKPCRRRGCSPHRGRGSQDPRPRVRITAHRTPTLTRGTSARRADGERAREAGGGADRGAGGERRCVVLRGMLSAATSGSAAVEAVYIFACVTVYD
jgi:hypothetical protein